MKTILTISLLWLSANLLHFIWISIRRVSWERSINRRPDGLLESASDFSLGRGQIAILMIHGFADTPAVFKPLASLFPKDIFTCRAMRLPGAGMPSFHAKHHLDTWVDAVDSEIASLRESHRSVWLVGHSMGGALALYSQLVGSAPADGLVLLAPLIKVSAARSPILKPHIWFKIAQLALPLTGVFESQFAPDVLTRDGSETLYTRDRFIPFATYKNLFTLTDILRSQASRISAPLLSFLVLGDRIVDTPASQDWLSSTASKLKETVILTNCGHAIPSEIERLPQLATQITSFIKQADSLRDSPHRPLLLAALAAQTKPHCQ